MIDQSDIKKYFPAASPKMSTREEPLHHATGQPTLVRVPATSKPSLADPPTTAAQGSSSATAAFPSSLRANHEEQRFHQINTLDLDPLEARELFATGLRKSKTKALVNSKRQQIQRRAAADIPKSPFGRVNALTSTSAVERAMQEHLRHARQILAAEQPASALLAQ